jgi:hypothetical protein
MSLTRLSIFRASGIRSLHTSAFRANEKTAAGILHAAPKAEPHAADAVAGKVPGLFTERLSPGEITAETINGAPSTLYAAAHLSSDCATRNVMEICVLEERMW